MGGILSPDWFASANKGYEDDYMKAILHHGRYIVLPRGIPFQLCMESGQVKKEDGTFKEGVFWGSIDFEIGGRGRS